MRPKVIQQLFAYLFDALFPPSQDLRLVRTLDADAVQSLCIPRIVEGVHTLMQYSNPSVRALIHEAKFHQNPHALALLGSVLGEYVMKLHPTQTPCIIPMPLSRARMRARGYNQVFEMLRYTKRELPTLDVNTRVLTRRRDTTPQTTLTRTERLKNMHDAFVVTNPDTVRDRHFILVDDVVTTGATMHAAKAALLPHSPASVTCIALAH